MMGDEKADPETSVPQDKGKEKETAKDGEGEGCARGQWGSRRGRWGGPGARGFHGRHGPWGRHHRGGFPGPWGAVLNDIFGDESAREGGNEAGDFKPDVDVFDTEDRFVIHVSLPGAKKEDVGVNWDAEKSEIQVAGVTYRPADEEVIKTLALDERKVGPFEKNVRLGSRANPAQVDADAISAKLEDGILVIEVPKLDKDYVEVKKVDVE
jgi:HSP20 family protein